MSSFDDAVAACREANAKMPPHLAAWLVAQQVGRRAYEQPRLGQALLDLMGGPGPEPLASIVARMVHPNVELRFPDDGRELVEALEAFIQASGRPAGPPQVELYLKNVAAAPKPKDSGEWLANRPAIDATGRVVGRAEAKGQVPAAAFQPPRPRDEELELARAPRKPSKEWVDPGPYRDDPGRRRTRAGVVAVVLLAVLGAATAAVFMFFPTLQRKLPLPVPPAQALVVTSTPPGATLLVEGQVIGTTPYAGDNRWRGRAKLELRLDGYEPFRDAFEGGRDHHVAVSLKKKR